MHTYDGVRKTKSLLPLVMYFTKQDLLHKCPSWNLTPGFYMTPSIAQKGELMKKLEGSVFKRGLCDMYFVGSSAVYDL